MLMVSGNPLVRFVGRQQASSVSDWALEILHQVASDINKLKRPLFPNFAVASWNDVDCLAGDKLQQDIRTWLSPPDPWKNYNIARESRHSGTGTWFVQGETFSEWKLSGPNSLLWIHGKRQFLPSVRTLARTNDICLSQRVQARAYFGTSESTFRYFYLG